MVSVICTNYNKGNWIKDAIESFLMQKTKFDFEIILIDDASSDKSVDAIRDYAEKYPDKIRAFYNKKNLGITKTWIKICKKAKGKYIARCDGDDFWIDENKLQKQVEILEKSKHSKWCTTDYNVVSPEGETIHGASFGTGIVEKSHSYAQMLANKGLTMASTWLVDTHLMNEINAKIDKNAIDDTFNIQLELFQSTKLKYLPFPSAAYRINEGSDSHPKDINDIKSRGRQLLKTQLEYIDKYNNDHKQIIKILLEKNLHYELLSMERLTLIQEQWKQMEEQERKIRNLENSRTYRIGNILVSPFRKIKEIIKR